MSVGREQYFVPFLDYRRNEDAFRGELARTYCDYFPYVLQKVIGRHKVNTTLRKLLLREPPKDDYVLQSLQLISPMFFNCVSVLTTAAAIDAEENPKDVLPP